MQIQASSRVQEDRGGSPQWRQYSSPTESVLKEDVTPVVGVKVSPFRAALGTAGPRPGERGSTLSSASSAPSLKVEASPKADNSQREENSMVDKKERGHVVTTPVRAPAIMCELEESEERVECPFSPFTEVP